MNRRIKHVGSIRNTEAAQDEYPKTVSDQGQWNYGQHQHGPFPWRTQEEPGAGDADNRQNQGRVDAAAFRRDVEDYIGQMKAKPIADNRSAGDIKKPSRKYGGPVLQHSVNPFTENCGERNHESQQRYRARIGAHEGLAQKEERDGRE